MWVIDEVKVFNCGFVFFLFVSFLIFIVVVFIDILIVFEDEKIVRLVFIMVVCCDIGC